MSTGMGESRMGSQAAFDTATGALRDPRQRYVRNTALLLLLMSALATGTAATLHALQENALLVDRVVPLLMSLCFLALAFRYWRQPEMLQSTIWLSWSIAVVGLAIPAWRSVVIAIHTSQWLVDTLPPITAVLLPLLLVMVVLAHPRNAWWASGVAWLAIASPVLVYLLLHPAQLWTPRGLDLVIAYGPASMFIPLLIPLLRGVERRIETLQEDGERLQALAERDVLVGLYNRRAGERFLSTLLANARAGHSAALILFDVDHFKRVNDQHGHPAGDAVLVEIGRRCAALLDEQDIFARWGGEEFLVVSPGSHGKAAEQLAQRLCAAVRASPITPVGTVTASFGVTSVRVGDTLGQVLQRADDALYRAKANGRDRVESALADDDGG
ncbi:MAG: GGDEF domain-containing protein [Pseudomarimonas sp.]